jgi:hypothetical protein
MSRIANASTIGAHSINITRHTAALGIERPNSDKRTCRITGNDKEKNGTAACKIVCIKLTNIATIRDYLNEQQH